MCPRIDPFRNDPLRRGAKPNLVLGVAESGREKGVKLLRQVWHGTMEDFDDLVQCPDESGTIDLSHRAWVTLDDAVWSWGASLIILNVSYNNIKTLSPKLGQLACLRDLNLSSNQLEDLPEEIGKCVRLKKLNLDKNKLKTLPVTIGNCKLLEELTVANNGLVNVPTEIGELTALRLLHLQNNKLEVLPPELGKCLSLEEVNVSNNQDLTNVPAQVVEDAALVLWMCRHNMKHKEAVEELEETNDDLEQAAQLTEEQQMEMHDEIEALKKKQEELLKERPEKYLKVKASVQQYSKTCALM
mmetsp:Transcript_12598/g.22870  ORF Transcript_12598/g.22870 Transcript_12598/m.22870 type:complete len:300 (+) Transcript_12598:225-1124(+)